MIRIRLRDYPRPPGTGFLELCLDGRTGEGAWLADCDLLAGDEGICAAAAAARQRLQKLAPGVIDGTTAWIAEGLKVSAERNLRSVLACNPEI